MERRYERYEVTSVDGIVAVAGRLRDAGQDGIIGELQLR
jgi:hypothetical protein